jgi:hypothetical protein
LGESCDLLVHDVDYLIEEGSVFDNNNQFMHYCDFQDDMAQETEGMISEDPQFINPPDPLDQVTISEMFFDPEENGVTMIEMQEFNLSLQNESPCINTGIPDTSLLNIPVYDYLGNPRVFGGRIDMGAIENQYVIWDNIDTDSKLIGVYPNPATDWIFVQLVAQNTNIEITDINSRTIISEKLTNSVIDISHLPVGMYIVKVNTGNEILTGKFFKEGNN